MSTQGSDLAIFYSTASNIVLLQAASPVMIALGALLSRRAAASLAVAGRGGVGERGPARHHERPAVGLRPGDIHAGDLINLVTLAGWSAYTAYAKRVLVIASPPMLTTAAYVAGMLLIVPTAIVTLPLFPPSSVRAARRSS